MSITIRRRISLLLVLLAILVGGFFYIYDKINLSVGKATESKIVTIEKGENALEVGAKLTEKKLITGKYYLAFYLWKSGKLRSLVAGTYEFSPGLKIPEISKIITGGEVAPNRVKLTIPEGWTAKQIAERIDNNGFSGKDFLVLVDNPSQQLKDTFPFLSEIPKGQSLEGYLFPDTYFFAKDATAEDIVSKMLKNFSDKISAAMLTEIKNQGKSLFEIVTMASIVEGEVKSESDRRIVAGLFWNRLAIGQAFGSDATLEYVLGGNKRQHSIAETRIDSPYNTYRFKGLPPGPVCNPGALAIDAALHPAKTEYNYFLSDPATGKTIFSKTFEEHVANKAKYGL